MLVLMCILLMIFIGYGLMLLVLVLLKLVMVLKLLVRVVLMKVFCIGERLVWFSCCIGSGLFLLCRVGLLFWWVFRWWNVGSRLLQDQFGRFQWVKFLCCVWIVIVLLIVELLLRILLWIVWIGCLIVFGWDWQFQLLEGLLLMLLLLVMILGQFQVGQVWLVFSNSIWWLLCLFRCWVRIVLVELLLMISILILLLLKVLWGVFVVVLVMLGVLLSSEFRVSVVELVMVCVSKVWCVGFLGWCMGFFCIQID